MVLLQKAMVFQLTYFHQFQFNDEYEQVQNTIPLKFPPS